MTAPHVRVAPLQGGSPSAHMVRDLALPPKTPRHEAVFELVRAVAWASTLGRQPVADHTLTDRATAASAPLLGADMVQVRSTIVTAIEALELLGDLTMLPGGQWVCTPLHVIATDSASTDILISGRPLRALPAELRPHVHLAGPLRRIAQAASPGLHPLDTETWLRRPGGTLTEWTGRILNINLAEPDRNGLRTGHYALYLPGQSAPAAPQDKRWRPTDPSLVGRHLARVRSLTGVLDYQVVELRYGGVIGAKSIDTGTARRLMYGLDLAAGNPTQASLVPAPPPDKPGAPRGRAKTVTLKTTNPLPRAETRSLMLTSVRPHTRDWLLPAHYADGVPELAVLGVDVMSAV